jgi:NhaP-type Na+/H+ or K+/H+ antiporter
MRSFVLEIIVIIVVALILGATLSLFMENEFWRGSITVAVSLFAGRAVNSAAYKPLKKDN